MSAPYQESAPPSGAPGGKTSLGLESNVGAMLCYIGNIICCLGIILSIIFVITEKENRFVKFHAVQSLFLFAVYVVLSIVIEILAGFWRTRGLTTVSCLSTWAPGCL